MAGASMNDIKARMKSVTSTMQITKAMELVASSKLRRARERLEASRPFYDVLHSAVSELEAVIGANEESVFSKRRDVRRTLYIVIAGDRGLAGAYNSNVFKLAERLSCEGDAIFLPVGKKALEYYRHRKRSLFTEACEYAADCGVGTCMALGAEIRDGYIREEFDKVTLVYTKFISMISEMPVYEEVLPLPKTESKGELRDPIIECDDMEEMLAKIIPEYIGGILWSALCEASAAEQGARRSSMNSANKNAEEMIDALTLKFNRARQAVITQEITEIVSGAEAL